MACGADKHVFGYANGQLRKDEQPDEIPWVVTPWQLHTGHVPQEVIFDSKLTTYANLRQLNRLGIRFI